MDVVPVEPGSERLWTSAVSPPSLTDSSGTGSWERRFSSFAARGRFALVTEFVRPPGSVSRLRSRRRSRPPARRTSLPSFARAESARCRHRRGSAVCAVMREPRAPSFERHLERESAARADVEHRRPFTMPPARRVGDRPALIVCSTQPMKAATRSDAGDVCSSVGPISPYRRWLPCGSHALSGAILSALRRPRTSAHHPPTVVSEPKATSYPSRLAIVNFRHHPRETADRTAHVRPSIPES